jgi:hypothetical protein
MDYVKEMMEQTKLSEEKSKELKYKSDHNNYEQNKEAQDRNTIIAEEAYTRRGRGRTDRTVPQRAYRGRGARGQYMGQRGTRYTPRGGFHTGGRDTENTDSGLRREEGEE